MANNTAKAHTTKAKTPVVTEVDPETMETNVVHDDDFRKPGKVKKGKMNFETNEIEYEEPVEDETPVEAPKVKTSKRQELADKMKAQRDKQPQHLEATVKGDILTLRPSQRSAPPAAERKVIEAPKDVKEGTKILTIHDLEKESGLDGKKIRRIIRNAGFRAPSTEDTGFGAKARYEWLEGDEILNSIRKLLKEEKGG